MKADAQFVLAFVRPHWVAGLLLIVTWSTSVPARAQAMVGGQLRAETIQKVSGALTALTPPHPPALGGPVVKRHVGGFYDDRSLDVSIAVEQVCTRYIRYTVRLQLPSGVDQSFGVTAPPGGLQPEVRDMTGDGIRNDLVLTPALLPGAPTVLVNDGHDHFVEANSGNFPGALNCGDNVAWSAGNVQDASALVSSGLRPSGLTRSGVLFLPQLKQTFFIPAAQTVATCLDHTPSSGRAPPVLLTNI